GRIPFVSAQHGDATLGQRGPQRLRILHDLRHILPPKRDHLRSRDSQRSDTIDLMRGGEYGKDRVRERLSQRWIIPNKNAALRAAEGLASRASHHCGALAEWRLKLAARDQSKLMRSIEVDAAIPLRYDVSHRADGEREERHRGAERNQLRSDKSRDLGEEIEVYRQLHRIKRHIHDMQATHASRTIRAIARM